MSKKAPAQGGASKAKAGADLKRRGTGKDGGKLGAGDANQPKEGDIYYRVVRSYPSFPHLPEETTITLTKPLDQLTLSKENEGGKGGRKSAEGNRRGSVLTGEKGRDEAATPEPGHDRERAASIAASVGGADLKKQQQRFVIWPEWNDADVNGEKWEVAHKGKEKGKSPVVQHFFEDPDGKIELPSVLKVETWKRPQDIVMDKPRDPVIVDPDFVGDFDLMTANDHVHESELMRWITSQIGALWKMSAVKNTAQENGDPPDEEFTHTWRPWDQIYAINKVGKGAMYNPYGKYVVKLYWMGCWRKIVIDDTLPYDENDRLLLPATTLCCELWPMLLTKALVKVAAVDYSGGSSACEFGDFSVIQCLTGWLPETIPLQYGHMTEIWGLLKTLVPEWKLPELDADKPPEGDTAAKDAASPDYIKDERTPDKEGKESVKAEKTDTKSVKDGKGKDEKKDKKEDKKDKKDKDKDKDKDKHKEKSMTEEMLLPDTPQIVLFASYSHPPHYPVRVSLLAEMADASEKMRQAGLSHMYPHPVMITQTRSCPLEPPPPPEKVPAWKLIRPRKKKTIPSDEPKEEEIPKPIQCVEITSPFLNYKVSPVPIPTHTHRAKSALERGGSRPATASVAAIEETDETVPDPEPELRSESKTEDTSVTPGPGGSTKQESTDTNTSRKEGASAKEKKRQSNSAVRKDKPEVKDPSMGIRDQSKDPEQASPRSERRSGASTPKQDRKRSATMRERVDSKSAQDMKKEMVKPEVKDKVEVKPADPPSQAAVPEGPAAVTENGVTEATPVAEAEKPIDAENTDESAEKQKAIWMDFEIFCKCFKTLYIFHKPNSYICNQKYSDLKVSTQNVSQPSKDKRSAPPTAGQVDERAPHYLFVDNLKPTEIVVSFSSLSRWHEPPAGDIKDKDSHSGAKVKDKSKDKADLSGGDSASVIDTSSVKGDTGQSPATPIQQGLLVAEPYSWKSLVTGQPILRLRSTATRAAVLSLPEGRHVLRFQMSAPLGYHVHLCSTVPFVFGDEEKVMAELTKESCRFVDNATQVMMNLGKCINSFAGPPAFKQTYEEFVNCHCPYRTDKSMSKQYHFKLFNEALYSTLKKVLSEAQLLTPETAPKMAFAWRAFNFDITTPNILQLGSGSRPATGAGSHRGSAKPSTKRPGESTKVDTWENREVTPDEHVAAVKIQKQARGYLTRRIKCARQPGTEEQALVMEQLQKAWSVLEANAEQYGLALFRTFFKADPDLMTKYAFYKDEWNKISYADYQGSHPDQPAATWFVVFREIFHVTEEMLCVPKLYVPLHTCMLRVVNNDTGEEVPRVFQKVAPYVYKRNKRGYSFVAEARSIDNPIQAGRWRMRLIGSLSPLPTPQHAEVNASFHTRELRDYYIPNEKNTILRYTVKVTEDHLASIQLQTSKPDVYIKLQVLDHEEELLCAVGKGHVVLPAFIFLKDVNAEEESKRSGSRASNRGGKVRGSTSSQSVTGKNKRIGSPSDGRLSRGSSRHSVASGDEEEEDTKPHKYIIQALVLRNSWPLSSSSWTFVHNLKEQEKNELKVSFHRERAPSPPKSEKQPSATSNKSKGKGKDKGGSKDKDKGSASRPPSQQFDLSKPHWTLRVVSDATAAEEIEVKKDTERADEIRAMKKAWEEAEPGRAAKAMQSRLKYLNSHMIKVQPEEETEAKDEDKAEGDSVDPPQPPQTPVSEPLENEPLTLYPPPPPMPKEVLQPIDITPFLRRTTDKPRLKDEAEIQRQLEAKQQEIAAYRMYREEVEAMRERDRQMRNLAKVKQLQMCEEMQAKLDAAREAINKPREAFRQKFLEVERKRLDEIAAHEAALRAEQEKSAPSPKGGRKSAKGKKTPPAGKKKK